MKAETQFVNMARYNKSQLSKSETSVAVESPLTIKLDDQEIVTLLCSPTNLNYLVAGYLFSEGFIKDKSDIKRLSINAKLGLARVTTKGVRTIQPSDLQKRIITSGCGRGLSFYSVADVAEKKVESIKRVDPEKISTLVKVFQSSSKLHSETHGVHSAALCNDREIILFREDVGRHNAIDKIFGQCLLEDVRTEDLLVITSGRISSEIIHKVAKWNVPFVVSISAPTNLGIEASNYLGITLIGSVKGERMNIFTNAWRVQSG